MPKILITGCLGFIGSHLITKLAKEKFHCEIYGLDISLNKRYYTKNITESQELIDLRKYRKHNIEPHCEKLYACDIRDMNELAKVYCEVMPDIVVNLAAKAGVRDNVYKEDYITTNILGMFNLLELASAYGTRSFIYASSSSVYAGDNLNAMSENDWSKTQKNLYAASKLCDEILASTYESQFKLTGLRFFTVYGPAGRPDMACAKFTKAILNSEVVSLYNNGNNKRDFTYIDDVVEGIYRVIKDDAESNYLNTGHNIYNIGNGNPVSVKEFVGTLGEILKEKHLIKDGFDFSSSFVLKSNLESEATYTWANTDSFEARYGFLPHTTIVSGINYYVDWYREFYGLCKA